MILNNIKMTDLNKVLSNAFDRLLKEKPTRPLIVNDKEYPLEVGFEMEKGVFIYKNGWEIHERYWGEAYDLIIYTLMNGKITVEYYIRFEKKEDRYELSLYNGFDKMDFLKIMGIKQSEKEVLNIIIACLKRE